MTTATQTAPAAGSGHHVREHRSVLAEAEKRVLVWLAHRMPHWVNSDHLTALGSVAMIGGGLAFAAAALDRRWLALVPVMLAINWFGDSLDGTVARVRNHQRPRYGFYVDHVVDLVNATALFVGLAFSSLMHPMLAIGLLLGYVLLAAESFLATHAVGIFRISFSGVGPTELRMLLATGALVAIDKPLASPFGLMTMPLFDIGGAIGLFGMSVAFAISSFRNGQALYRAEPLPSRRGGDEEGR